MSERKAAKQRVAAARLKVFSQHAGSLTSRICRHDSTFFRLGCEIPERFKMRVCWSICIPHSVRYPTMSRPGYLSCDQF